MDVDLVTESDIDLSDELDEIEELRDEVLSVYEQIRNLVVNLKRSKPSAVSHKGQSISASSLHTSIASSESSEHSGVQFQVNKTFRGCLISFCITNLGLNFPTLQIGCSGRAYFPNLLQVFICDF